MCSPFFPFLYSSFSLHCVINVCTTQLENDPQSLEIPSPHSGSLGDDPCHFSSLTVVTILEDVVALVWPLPPLDSFQ